MSGVWVFGYGSLVSPDSFGHTLGRTLRLGTDLLEAEIAGYGRRWNYGVVHSTASTVDESGRVDEWTVVALGVVAAPGESVNGVIGWVSDDELGALDRRERYYDRVDVTARLTLRDAVDFDATVVTYVPRAEPLERYRRAKELGRAAVDQRYYQLVDRAFADLGADRHERYHRTTPPPDVPVLPLRRPDVSERYRAADRD